MGERGIVMKPEKLRVSLEAFTGSFVEE